MKIAIVGAGGVGAYSGAALAHSGHDVRLFARGEHLAAIRARGLEVREAGKTSTVALSATDRPEELGPADVAIYLHRLLEASTSSPSDAEIDAAFDAARDMPAPAPALPKKSKGLLIQQSGEFLPPSAAAIASAAAAASAAAGFASAPASREAAPVPRREAPRAPTEAAASLPAAGESRGGADWRNLLRAKVPPHQSTVVPARREPPHRPADALALAQSGGEFHCIVGGVDAGGC